MRHRLFRLLNSIQKWDIWPVAFRRVLMKAMGIEVGDRVVVTCDVDFVFGKIILHDRVFINRGVLIDGEGSVAIGAATHIAPRCMILTATHAVGNRDRRAGGSTRRKVSVGRACWIGAGSTILPGVAIGDGVIVGAGSVVTGHIPDDELHAGVPAVLKKRLASEGLEE
ncbi:acyltransferase [Novosphingobium album (ex Liu et al. 2023)]|uniref:DapH/DapD/GlmU-related protein n=1 Tax=Novosphingobium album (ex Liu et al. 2023) TaxID=3031130 RepID=A0ABT5WKR2_9SPHN|nr:DapH/DapD/GlmU-related protein [Novosphingobium album (ex Liu et al. 2023)]MDE8650489.1 DapH/DapD/GlmU-related protein [Novosphingobium album (ex Liu et al. 2023)]